MHIHEYTALRTIDQKWCVIYRLKYLLKASLSESSLGAARPSMAPSDIAVRLDLMALCPNLKAAVANSLNVVAEH